MPIVVVDQPQILRVLICARSRGGHVDVVFSVGRDIGHEITKIGDAQRILRIRGVDRSQVRHDLAAVAVLSPDLEDQLRHRGLKAALFLEHGDPTEAKRELEAAVGLVPAGEEERLDWDETLLLIWCLTHLGLLGGHAKAFERAIRLIQTELDHAGITTRGEGVLYKELGDVHRYARAPARAEAAYRSALKRSENTPARIFLAEALLFQGRLAEARRELQPLETTAMEREEQEDHLFVSAALAVHLGETKALEAASSRLRAWRGSAPYFEQRRLAFLVAVEDTLKQGANDTLIAKARRLLADPIAVFNRYVLAEPNFMGVGVRLNNVLEDLARPKPRPSGHRGDTR